MNSAYILTAQCTHGTPLGFFVGSHSEGEQDYTDCLQSFKIQCLPTLVACAADRQCGGMAGRSRSVCVQFIADIADTIAGSLHREEPDMFRQLRPSIGRVV